MSVNEFLEGDMETQVRLWNLWFLDDSFALHLIKGDKGQLLEVLKLGLGIPVQWTTTRCAVRLKQMTDVALVLANTSNYNHVWLYAIALAAEVDPGAVELGDQAATVAFTLASRWAEAAAGGPPGAGISRDECEKKSHGQGRQKEQEDDEEGGLEPLSWEEVSLPLPGMLGHVLARFAAGELELDYRSLMCDLPRYDGLKRRAEVNNHRTDGQRALDKVLRQGQNKVLGLCRMFATAIHELETVKENSNISEEPPAWEDVDTLLQKVWACMLDLEDYFLTERKRASIPGAIRKEDQLFTTEDLKYDNDRTKINKAGMTASPLMVLSGVFFVPQDTKVGSSDPIFAKRRATVPEASEGEVTMQKDLGEEVSKEAKASRESNLAQVDPGQKSTNHASNPTVGLLPLQGQPTVAPYLPSGVSTAIPGTIKAVQCMHTPRCVLNRL